MILCPIILRHYCSIYWTRQTRIVMSCFDYQELHDSLSLKLSLRLLITLCSACFNHDYGARSVFTSVCSILLSVIYFFCELHYSTIEITTIECAPLFASSTVKGYCFANWICCIKCTSQTTSRIK